MSDPTQTSVDIPSLAELNIGGTVRHLVGGAGMFLVGHGVLTQSQDLQFVQLATGVVMFVAAVAWSYVQKHWLRGVMVLAANAPVPTLPVT